MESTWVQLATQAPIVLIFGVLMWMITDRFLKAMEKRDTAFLAELILLRKSQDQHDEYTRGELAKLLGKMTRRQSQKTGSQASQERQGA
jgi:hypothetical protein